MSRYSKAKINKMLTDSDKADNADLKGQIFEDLCIYLLQKISGLTLIDRNVENPDDAEEIDLVFGNNLLLSQLSILPPVFFIECKNLARAMSASQVRDFIGKLNSRNAKVGLIFSSKNVTGHKNGQKHASSVIIDALKINGIIIIVIDRSDIENFTVSDDLKNLILAKYLNRFVYGTI